MPKKFSIPADTYSFELPREITAVREACRQARTCLAESGLTEAELDAWELVVVEAGNNAVIHADGDESLPPVQIEIVVTEELVEVRMVDHTAGFEFPEKSDLPPDDSESGRGLFLIQKLTDEARYWRGHGENCLTLRKRRQPTATPGMSEEARLVAELKTKLAESENTLDLMTAELASAYESLSTIFRFSAGLADQLKPEDFARKWLGELTKMTGADWFILRLVVNGGRALKLAAHSGDAPTEPLLSMENVGVVDASVEARATYSRTDIWFDRAHPTVAPDPLAQFAPGGNGFAHPIVVNDQVVGVLTVGRRNSDVVFEAGQVSLIQTFADFLGIQIRNAQITEQQLLSRLTGRELEIAADIQHSLLPTKLPELSGFRLLGHYQSARQIGGDFYDAFVTPDGGLLLAIADVMGKGVPAAMFAAIFRSQLRAGMERATSPGALLNWLNQTLFPDLDRVEMFITAQIVYLNPRRRTLRMAAAGHPPLFLIGSDALVQKIENEGMPLGVLPDAVYTEKNVPLPTGARLLLFTDGLTEASDARGKLLGLTPIEDCFRRCVRDWKTLEQTKDALIALVATHRGTAAANDDETFLLLTETQPAPS